MTLLSLAVALVFAILFLKVTGLVLHLVFGPLALIFVVAAIYYYFSRGKQV